jgi:hypothetical protein
MLHDLGVVGQFGVDDQRQARQVDAACRDVGRDADPRPAVAQRLQRRIALALAEFARERHGREAALQQDRLEMAHGVAGVAEHQRARRIMEAQQVDDGELGFLRVDPDGAIFDIGMAARAAGDLDAQRIVLVVLGELDDRLGQRRREQQALALGRRRLQDEFEIVAEAEIEHLVGLVEHDGLQRGNVEPVALDMVAQAAGRADDDMGALIEQRGLAARVHAADAGDDAGIGVFVEPGELALDLQRQFARRRDDQRQRLAGAAEGFGLAEQGRGDGEPIGDSLAGAGLR